MSSDQPDTHPKTADADHPYRDPDHPGNRIRPRVKCIGCGTHGCITGWGPWCFACNVERMDRIGAQFDKVRKALYG